MYSWHFTTENDRSWLEEAMTTRLFSNPDTAISMNQDNSSRSSVIGSENGQRIVWIAQKIEEQTLTITAIAIHPNYRNQNYIRKMGLWYLSEAAQYHNVTTCKIITGASFSASVGLFQKGKEIITGSMKISKMEI